MTARAISLFRRFELLLLGGTVIVLALGTVKAAWATDGNCVDACAGAFGVTFEDRGYFWVLNDCGTSELGTGRVWCRYVGTRL